jgi:hypothetical protein
VPSGNKKDVRRENTDVRLVDFHTLAYYLLQCSPLLNPYFTVGLGLTHKKLTHKVSIDLMININIREFNNNIIYNNITNKYYNNQWTEYSHFLFSFFWALFQNPLKPEKTLESKEFCGLYYKHVAIVNDDSSIVSK